MKHRPVLTLAAALAIAGCGTTLAPDPVVPESALHFLTPDSGAPGFLGDTVRFYAVAGQDRSVVIYYQDSVPFMTFDVPANALAMATGDSVLITVAIADSSRLIVGFQPAGLTFVNGHPAELTLSYAHAKHSVSPNNAPILSLWKQENPGEPWHKIVSNTRQDLQTVTGRIAGFTVYATAY